MIRLIAVLFVAATAIGASGVLATTTPTNWKVLVDTAKACQISVPPDWIGDSSPDRQVGILSMVGTDHGETLAVARQRMEYHMRSSIKVFEDSKRRLWFSYHDDSAPEGSRETIYYVAIPVNGNVCSARIYFHNSKLNVIAKQIAESLGPAN
jgi:hypothetical protein